MTSRFIKIGNDGSRLAPDATQWGAVLDATTGLMWDAKARRVENFQAAQTLPGTLNVAGFTDWRAPTVEELFCLADRRRAYPVIDTYFFPDTPSERFWASDGWAPAHAGCAWIVHFGGGSSYWVSCGAAGFVRAVRDGGGR